MALNVKLTILPVLLLAASGCRVAIKPNIVLILADDMGYGDLGCQNPNSKIPTPNLDGLAAQGMRFTDAHSASGISSPSRYSILTGRYHWRGHLTSGIINEWGDPAIESGRMTIASMLKEAGYSTACIGKWHLGEIWPFKPGLGQKDPAKHKWTSISMNGKNEWTPDAFDWNNKIEDGPLNHGFDYYFGTDVINFPPYTWIENDKVLEVPEDKFDMKDSIPPDEGSWECRQGPAAKNWDIRKVPMRLLEKTVKWINSHKGKKVPFFLYYALPSPHAPIIPAEQFHGKSKAGAYGDYVVETDWIVGQVMDALDRNGFEKNTIVIFTSDNGPEIQAYPRIRTFDHYSMGDLRGLKRDLWEGGHRIPFIVRYPGKIPAGSVCDKLISQTDILATIAAFTGCKIGENAGEDSFNMKDVFMGQLSAKSKRDFIVYHSSIGSFAVRKGDWVLVEGRSGGVADEPEWLKEMIGARPDTTPMVLYNLGNNLKETSNLFIENPQKVNELKELLDQIRRNGRSAPSEK